MPTLLKIGIDYYLVKDAAAARIITSMAGAVKMQRDYGIKDDGVGHYYPQKHQDEISMISVRASQILPCKPGEEQVEEDRVVYQQPAPKKILRISAGE